MPYNYYPGYYGGGRAWSALGAGLRDLGSTLVEMREREEARRRAEAQEELARRSVQAQELARPGARTLGGYLGDPRSWRNAGEPMPMGPVDPQTGRRAQPSEAAFRAAAREGPLEPETAAWVADADAPAGPINFRMPAPQTVRTPAGGEITIQDRAPYVTAAGTVMDPQAARREQTNAAIAQEAQVRAQFPPAPQEPGPYSPEAIRAYRQKRQIDAEFDEPRAREPMSYQEAMAEIWARHGEPDPEDPEGRATRLPTWATDAWISRAVAELRAGRPMPRPPRQPDLSDAFGNWFAPPPEPDTRTQVPYRQGMRPAETGGATPSSAPSTTGTPMGSAAQREWDRLAAIYGRERTEQEIGPRPLR